MLDVRMYRWSGIRTASFLPLDRHNPFLKSREMIESSNLRCRFDGSWVMHDSSEVEGPLEVIGFARPLDQLEKFFVQDDGFLF